MSKGDITTRQEDFDLAGAAVFTALAAGVKRHPAIKDNPIAEATIDIVFPMMGLALSRTAYMFLGERLPPFSQAYAAELGNDPRRLREHAAQNANNPDHHEILYQGFRRLQDAVDPSVFPVLGTLAAQYNVQGKKADAHYRSLGRLLCDLERGDLQELRTLLRGILECEDDLNEVGAADVIINWHAYEKDRPSTIEVDFGRSEYGEIGHLESADRLFLLLKREGFAFDRDPREADKDHGPRRDDALCIEFDKVRQLLDTIDVNTSRSQTPPAEM